ncbi:MAG TPA: hypothetical protein VMU87_06910 [Stellaceae bacterium]|nr:hypothetical protein [Stellaceae bacterium]
MSPHKVDPNVDYKRLHELSEEFTALWNRLQALYLDAAAGFMFVHANVEAYQKKARQYVEGSELDSEAFQDTRRFDYTNILPDGFVTSAIHQSTQGEAKERNKSGGQNFIMMAQLCIVSFYDFWEEYLRREYAVAKGKLAREEKDDDRIKEAVRHHARHDIWGDLYYFRTSIVHKLGVANSDVARCRVFQWFKPDDEMNFTPAQMREIFLALLAFRNELFSEQFPEHYIEIPPV